jgi:3-oxoacyl-[acyl-carrier protein] reductase
MDLGIAGRVAVVTGGGRGIGAAVADALRAEGGTVVDASRANGIDVTAPDGGEHRVRADRMIARWFASDEDAVPEAAPRGRR